jgi:D-arabinose 1-dehydrogenase-like Zn-dependent alcohol dehydrogenase
VRLQGFTTDGFFAEYAVVDYHNAIILPENLKTETAAPIFCAGITGEKRWTTALLWFLFTELFDVLASSC